jgi:hypothetical protein
MALLLVTAPVWGEVLLRWTQPAIPPVARMGIRDVVVPWNAEATIKSVHRRGYRVYAEVPVSAAARMAAKALRTELAGIILSPGDSNPGQVDEARHALDNAYPGIPVLALNSQGRQPQMKGQLVIKKDGVLQVTSPTAQPWIDSNLALIRLDQALRAKPSPLYEFEWDQSDSLKQQQGPDTADYLLAVAEAGAFHASLILHLHPKLQAELLKNKQAAWAELRQVRRYLEFSSRAAKVAEAEANVGVLTDNDQNSYEAVNLLARHNIAFDILKPSALKPDRLEAFDLLVVFVEPDEGTTARIADFASRGGIAILVDSHRRYPWQSAPQVKSGEHSVSYAVGKGRILELSEPVIDPETFSQDIRRLIENDRIVISLWNALTTVAVSYHAPGSAGKVLELVNYAQEPLRVQVRVKGSFACIRYETPESGCCQALMPVEHEGFTEFLVPSLQIAGRVHLAECPLPSKTKGQ